MDLENAIVSKKWKTKIHLEKIFSAKSTQLLLFALENETQIQSWMWSGYEKTCWIFQMFHYEAMMMTRSLLSRFPSCLMWSWKLWISLEGMKEQLQRRSFCIRIEKTWIFQFLKSLNRYKWLKELRILLEQWSTLCRFRSLWVVLLWLLGLKVIMVRISLR